MDDRYRGRRVLPPPRTDRQDIHRYVGILAENRIDTLNACSGVAYYPSKTISQFRQLSPGQRPFLAQFGWDMTPNRSKLPDRSSPPSDGYLDLAGRAWIGWRNGQGLPPSKISPWVNVRANDMQNPKYQDGYYMHLLVQRRPCDCAACHNPTALDEGWRGFNYAKPKVRDHMMTILRDAIGGMTSSWSLTGALAVVLRPDAPGNTATSSHSGTPKFALTQQRQAGQAIPARNQYFGTLDQMRSIGRPARDGATGNHRFVSPTNCWKQPVSCDESTARVRRGGLRRRNLRRI